MADPSHRVTIIVAVLGVIGTIGAAVIQNWEKIMGRPAAVSESIPPTPPPRLQAAIEQPSKVPDAINLTGVWRELYPNPGNISQTTQVGNTLRFTINGVVQGRSFRSDGSGVVSGNHIETTYQSTLPSLGRCEGTVSPDGMRITTTCIDSVYGQFVAGSVRQ